MTPPIAAALITSDDTPNRSLPAPRINSSIDVNLNPSIFRKSPLLHYVSCCIVASVSEDVKQGVLAPTTNSSKPGREGLLRVLDDRKVRVVAFSAWERIDKEEKRLGSLRNKPREKMTTWEELLKAASE